MAIDRSHRQTEVQQQLTGVGRMSDFFRLHEHGTSIGREIMAGATTFAAMAYILVVNPQIMALSLIHI